jgi:hypothetical protein
MHLRMQDNKGVLPKGKLEKEFGNGVMFCTCESCCRPAAT